MAETARRNESQAMKDLRQAHQDELENLKRKHEMGVLALLLFTRFFFLFFFVSLTLLSSLLLDTWLRI